MSDYFHESMVAKMVSSNEYQQGYSVGFSSGYNQALEDCCNVLRQCWLNGTVANRIIEEQIAEIEKLKR